MVAHLGWVDFDFGSSSGCQILLELMGVWQNWLGRSLCGQHDGTYKSNKKARLKLLFVDSARGRCAAGFSIRNSA